MNSKWGTLSLDPQHRTWVVFVLFTVLLWMFTHDYPTARKYYRVTEYCCVYRRCGFIIWKCINLVIGSPSSPHFCVMEQNFLTSLLYCNCQGIWCLLHLSEVEVLHLWIYFSLVRNFVTASKRVFLHESPTNLNSPLLYGSGLIGAV